MTTSSARPLRPPSPTPNPTPPLPAATIEQIAASGDMSGTRRTRSSWLAGLVLCSPVGQLAMKSANEPSNRPECLIARRQSPAMSGKHDARSPTTGHCAVPLFPPSRIPTLLPPSSARPRQAKTPPFLLRLAACRLKLDGYRIPRPANPGGAYPAASAQGPRLDPPQHEAHRGRSRPPHRRLLTLDGEVVVLLPDGTTSASPRPPGQLPGRHAPPPHLFLFRSAPSHWRPQPAPPSPFLHARALLADVIAHADPHILHLSEHLTSGGPSILRNAFCRMPHCPPEKASCPSAPQPHTPPAAPRIGSSANASTNRNSSSAASLCPPPDTPAYTASARCCSATTLAPLQIKSSSTPAAPAPALRRRRISSSVTNSDSSLNQKSPFDKGTPTDACRGAHWVPPSNSSPRFASPLGPPTASFGGPPSWPARG